MSVDKLMEKSENKDDEKDMDESMENSKNDTHLDGDNSSKPHDDNEDDTKDGIGEKDRNPTATIRHFKEMYANSSRENIHLHQTITILQEKQHIMSLKVGKKFTLLFAKLGK